MRFAKCALVALAATGIVTAPSAADETVAARVTSVATGDINGDGRRDTAFLIAPDEEAGAEDHALVVSFGDEFEDTVSLVAYVPDFVWGGTGVMVGNRASVEIRNNGSLAVRSHNEAVGRDRWSQTITIAWRDEMLVVAGFTYSFYDTLDNDNTGGCDLNLLNGKGTRTTGETTEPFSPAYTRVPLQEWKQTAGDDPCGFWTR